MVGWCLIGLLEAFEEHNVLMIIFPSCWVYTILHLDPFQQSLLDAVQDGVVLDDGQVFGLGLEHLVRILARGHGTNGHLLLLHLLGNLARS